MTLFKNEDVVILVTNSCIQENLFYISGNVSGSPTSYSAHAFDPVSGVSINNSIIGLSPCKKGSGCPVEFPSSFGCSQSTVLNVTISAANKLGGGPRSNPVMIGKIATCSYYLILL